MTDFNPDVSGLNTCPTLYVYYYVLLGHILINESFCVKILDLFCDKNHSVNMKIEEFTKIAEYFKI